MTRILALLALVSALVALGTVIEINRSHTVVAVRAYDIQTGKWHTIVNPDCRIGDRGYAGRAVCSQVP